MTRLKKSNNKSYNKKYDTYFQYAVTVALNQGEIKKDLHRITKNKPFINKYNFEETNFPLEKDDWKILEKNNLTTALNTKDKEKKKFALLMFQNITQILKAKVNLENQVILLMIPNREGWQYLAVQKYQCYQEE